MAVVRVEFDVDTKGAVQGVNNVANSMDGVSRASKRVEQDLKTATSEMDKLGKSIAAGLGIGVGIAGVQALIGGLKSMGAVLADATTKAVEYGSKINDLAAKTGIAASSLQRLEAAGNTAGVSLDSISGAVSKMQRNIVEGSSAFGRLGLTLADLKKLSPEQQFQQIGQAISELGTPAEKAAAAMEIFGKSGADLLPVFNDLENAMARAQDRIVMTDEMVAGLDEVGDAAGALQEDWSDLWMNIGATIATTPGAVEGIGDIAAALRDMSKWVQENEAKVRTWGRTILGIAGSFTGLTGIVQGVGAMLPKADAPDGGLAGGGSSGGWAAPRSFVGKNAYAEAGREAEKARREMEKAREELQKFMDKWGSLGPLNAEQKPFGKLEFNPAAEAAAALKDEESKRKLMLALAEDELKLIQAGIDKWQRYGEIVAGIADIFTMFGMSATSALGQVLGGLEQGIAAAVKYKEAMADGDKVGAALAIGQAAGSAYKSKSVLGGAATGAMTGFAVGGPVGAAVGAVAGGLLSFIGNAKRAREEMARLRTEFYESAGGLDALKKQAEAAGVSLDEVFDADSVKELSAAIDEVKNKLALMAEFEDLMKQIAAVKLEFLTRGIEGLGAMFNYASQQADITGERLDQLGTIGFAMFESLREQGYSMVEALKMMGPAIDQAILAYEKAGLEASGAFAALIDFREKVLANEDLVSAIDGWSAAFSALEANGMMTADMFAIMDDELQRYIADLLAQGFTQEQATAMSLPALYQLYLAQQKYGFALDETTQALVDQALASGAFDDMKDPLSQLVELQELMLLTVAALVQAFGEDLPEAVRKYIAEMDKIPKSAGSAPAPPGGSESPYDPGDRGNYGDKGYAEGGYIPAIPGGKRVIVGEGNEGEYIIPESKMGRGSVTIGQGAVQVNLGNVSVSNGVELADLQQAIEDGSAQGVVTALKLAGLAA